MTSFILGKFITDYLLIENARTSHARDKNTVATTKKVRSFIDRQSFAASKHMRLKQLCNEFAFRLNMAAINNSLAFKPSKPLAIISGAGIAGLAASFELRARGFNVLIAEKRSSFTRSNIINLNLETQAFLKRFHLLEKFEKHIAARIKEHRSLIIETEESTRHLGLSDVSELNLDRSLSFEPENFSNLFNLEGIYSVSIAELQTFLAENVLRMGAYIFGDVTPQILSRTNKEGVSKVQVTFDQILRPDLFFITEGAHSSTARQLGIKDKKVMNVCTGENWIFGNMTYPGKETFVVSLIDVSGKTLRIANMIFNAKSQVINLAVTSDKRVSEDAIREQIHRTALQVFAQKTFPIEKMPSTLLNTVAKPVVITNRITSLFSTGNVFCLGDSAGSSSPLAGLGGTLGLTLVPRTVKQLLDDYERQSKTLHENFHRFSEAYVQRWIQKSEGIKKFCINTFQNELQAKEKEI